MLRGLDIRNVAVIEKLSIEFKNGMTVLTGETGAGKSIIIDSINMILGERANRTLIRHGCEKAFVSASFELSEQLRETLGQFGIECEEDSVILSREINQDGKSTARINGMMVPSSVLREVSPQLINIHGQHDNQAILNSTKHIDFLDIYSAVSAELEEYVAKYAEVRRLEAELDGLRVDEEEKLRRIDLLKYQTTEIEKAMLKEDEKEQLLAKRSLMQNSERIAEGVARAYNALFESETGSAYDAVSVAESALESLDGIDENLSVLSSRLVDIKYALEDIVHELRLIDTDYDEKCLNELEERLDTITKLEKKYGGSVAAVLDFYQGLTAELDKIENNDEIEAQLEKELTQRREELKAVGVRLYEKRRSGAQRLSREILGELADLDMEKARFEVKLEHGDEFFKNGMDKAEFLITTNPGEPLKPLTRVASGGELSRVMLAIKTVLAGNGEETLIFDEIDTGVSGGAAQKIASKLWSLGSRGQVVCISHQPQLAAFADNHFYIEKTVTQDSAKTTLRELSDEERKLEVARITDGSDITEAALIHAGEMLGAAMEKKKQRKCGK